MEPLKGRATYLRIVLCFVWLCVACVVAYAENPASVAENILSTVGVEGGLVVHVGCGDGRLTAALHASDGYLVHGLETDPSAIGKARELVQSQGLTDGVAVAQWDGGRLPFGDGVVNLIVVGPGQKLPTEELMRVLAPHGVACVPEDGRWKKRVKPWPEDIDEWTHFMHGPDGNMVAEDTAVDIPYHLQWIGEPIRSKSHAHLSSVNNMVSAGGRLFYVADMGQLGLPYSLPPHWFLVACDAFSGKMLWKREMGKWQPYKVPGRLLFPTDLYRRLVASRDRVYATLDIFGPVVAIDAATGRTMRVYEGTDLAREIVHCNGVLYVVTGTEPPEKVDRRTMASWIRQEPRRLLAIEADTGRVLWEKHDTDTESLIEMSLAAKGGRIYFQNTESLLCLDAESGETVWNAARPSSYPRPAWAAPTLVAQGDVVLSADRAVPRRLRQLGPGDDLPRNLAKKGKARSGTVMAFSAKTGKKLWEAPCAEGHYSPVDVFVVDGKVFIGEKHLRKPRDYCTVRDLYTGEVVKKFESPDEGWVDFHHHRCYRDKATERYVLAGRTGVEFMDVQTGEIQPHRWIRGICRYGVLPCNGLLYLPPDQCGCYIQSKLTGFHVLAPARHGKGMKDEWEWNRENRLQEGPAYAWAQKQDFSNAPEQDQWTTYRHDKLRSSCTKGNVSAKGLKRAWTKKLGGRLTQPVVGDGRLLVVSVDRRTLYALDAENGDILWEFSTGGRLDSPPTLVGGLAVFGCRDGNVYALRARDGDLVWRFRAAPRDQWMYVEGQMESVWPVHGSVLVDDGTVCLAAGRNSYVDGGVFMYRLDVRTGEPLVEKRFCSRDPETGRRVNLFEPYDAELLPDRELPGVLPDVPSSDGKNIWMRSVTFDQSLDIKEEYPPHLFCSMGFLDHSWWELTYWIYGRHFFCGRKGVDYAKAVSPSGRIMVFDDSRTYGYKDETWTGKYGCRPGLFSTRKWPPNLVEIDLPRYRRGAYRRARHTAVKPDWRRDVPLLPNAMVLCGDTLFVAGSRGFDQDEAASYLGITKVYSRPVPPAMREGLARWKGEEPGRLMAVDKTTGKTRADYELQSVPIFDGMIAAGGRLYLSGKDGRVTCMGAE